MQDIKEELFDSIPVKEHVDGKMFDNYGPVEVKEAIGTFFLGILAIWLFIALQRTQNRYEALLLERAWRSR